MARKVRIWRDVSEVKFLGEVCLGGRKVVLRNSSELDSGELAVCTTSQCSQPRRRVHVAPAPRTWRVGARRLTMTTGIMPPTRCLRQRTGVDNAIVRMYCSSNSTFGTRTNTRNITVVICCSTINGRQLMTHNMCNLPLTLQRLLCTLKLLFISTAIIALLYRLP